MTYVIQFSGVYFRLPDDIRRENINGFCIQMLNGLMFFYEARSVVNEQSQMTSTRRQTERQPIAYGIVAKYSENLKETGSVKDCE